MNKTFARLGLIAMSLLAVGCDTTNVDDTVGSFYADYNKDAFEQCKPRGDKFDEFPDNPFVSVAEQHVSTFSVDADGASYAVMRRYLSSGYTIDPQSVRIEEFLNYFTFDYPNPIGNESIAINAEVGDCPWNAGHKLLRLGIKGKGLAKSEVPKANFVFLVDVSGSMYTDDKLKLLKSGLIELVYKLNPDDRISIITYSGVVKKLLESTPAREAAKIKSAISKLQAEGCTNGGDALKMAYEEALKNYDAKRNNRIVLGTDGDFNVGVTNIEMLAGIVEKYAKQGIYMTCLGFGMGNLNDAMMERISNLGNGAYHYIDCEDEMMKVFVTERERFVSVANDTKCQLTFDSKLVSKYRLIGYENRVMNNEDFDNDAKDAGEIGAGQTITALYEIVPTDEFKNNPKSTFCTFDVRYKRSLSDESVPMQLKVAVEESAKPASANLNFASGVAAYGMILRNSPYKGDATYDMACRLIKSSLSFDPDHRRSELLNLITKAAQTK